VTVPGARSHDASLALLVLQCQSGSDRAFARLVDMFSERTLAYLRGLVGDDADDVHQELWLGVYRHIASLANPGAFRTWLFQTTRHCALDQLRKRKREGEVFADVEFETVDAAEDAGDPAEFDTADVDAVLMQIPPPQREVILLHYRDDLSYADIAVVVGCPIGTVRTRLHHAKRKLRELLNAQRGEV